MFYLRLLFALLLSLPQGIAPLLHAHVGGEVDESRVHLPGLEALGAADQVLQEAESFVPHEGQVVSLGQGLHKPAYPLPLPAVVIVICLLLLTPRLLTPLAPQAQAPPAAWIYLTPQPRAPPKSI